MTDPLSPEEIAEKRAVPEDYGAIGLSRGTYFRLLDIAEDHARLVAEVAKLIADNMAQAQQLDYEHGVALDAVRDRERETEALIGAEYDAGCLRADLEAANAENAKLRERVEKLEAAGATVLRGFDEGAFVRNVRGDHDPAWAIKLLPYLAALAVLAACDESE